MSLSLVQLETELLAHLGLDVTDFTNGLTDVDLLLNRSYWKVCDAFKFREKEQLLVSPLIVNQATYNIATLANPLIFDSVQNVAIEDHNTLKHTSLNLMEYQIYQDNYINLVSENAKPINYIRYGTSIIFYPTPDYAYNITYNYWNVIADIGVTPSIPQSWHEIILYGALWRGFLRLGDYNRSDAAKDYQDILIRDTTPVESKELENANKAGLAVLGREY